MNEKKNTDGQIARAIISGALEEPGCRIVCGSRQLVMSEDGGEEFTVYNHEAYTRTPQVLYRGPDFAMACAVLTKA